MGREVNEIFVHHTATEDTPNEETSEIEKFHEEERGWKDLGYHCVVESVNNSYRLFDGRPENEIGAHAQGRNTHSLGIAFVGNYEQNKPNNAMLKKGSRRIARWVEEYGVQFESIKPHKAVKATKCPGQYFDIPLLKYYVKQSLTERLELCSWDTIHYQIALTMYGIDAGPFDNIEGPKTNSALEQFKDEIADNDYGDKYTKPVQEKLLRELKIKYHLIDQSEVMLYSWIDV
jgi:hypothetical protein